MANKQRGELQIVVGEKTYVMRLTTNCACQMESASGRPFDQVIAGSLRGSLSDLRLFLWASLLSRQPEMTLEQVGDVIDEIGPKALKQQLDDLVALNSAEMSKAGSENPPEAQGGTGGNSTSTRGVAT